MSINVNLSALAKAVKKAARTIANLDSGSKNEVLKTIAILLLDQKEAILEANQKDLAAAQDKGLSAAMVDRLALSVERLQSIANAVLEVAALPDPVGELTKGWTRPNGIKVQKIRIPLGVICMIYESRPNVTIDAAVLCLKAGNGIILRGGSEAFHSNMALTRVLQMALEHHNLPASAATLVPTTDRAAMDELLTFDEDIDLVIPRGGEGLIRFVAKTSRIPVIKHYKGVCHLYVDKDADVGMALGLLLDGKTSRPGVCNALETMLVHESIADAFLPVALQALGHEGVEVYACPKTRQYGPHLKEAGDEHFAAEFLEKIIAVKVVSDQAEAVAHIHQFGSDHTEVICTNNILAANAFTQEINSSVVMVNASSRFSDGGQLGLGAEIGISTTKLHAFGPMGLAALTTEKFVVIGNGQKRH